MAVSVSSPCRYMVHSASWGSRCSLQQIKMVLAYLLSPILCIGRRCCTPGWVAVVPADGLAKRAAGGREGRERREGARPADGPPELPGVLTAPPWTSRARAADHLAAEPCLVRRAALVSLHAGEQLRVWSQLISDPRICLPIRLNTYARSPGRRLSSLIGIAVLRHLLANALSQLRHALRSSHDDSVELATSLLCSLPSWCRHSLCDEDHNVMAV